MESIPPLIAGLLLVAVGVIVFLTVFVWRWAVGRSTGEAADPLAVENSGGWRYAAIGASDVTGVGAANPERDNWASVLHDFMPPGTTLYRFARSGITLREANAREVFDAVRAAPDLVTLWNCVNDIGQRVPLPDYRRELEIALNRLTSETGALILVLNVPDLSILLPSALPAMQRELIRGGIVQWNRTIDEVAGRYGARVEVLDLFGVSEEMMAKREFVATDGFHLSTAGHRALAGLAWEAIVERFPRFASPRDAA
jgi:lysophospholipase L1-like esterase